MDEHTSKKDPKNAVFILNPVSGVGDHAKNKEQIIKFAREMGWKGKIIETTRKQSGGMIAVKEMALGASHLIICGGDGTIMNVLQKVVDRDIVLGIIPLGTGNLVTQNLNIEGNLKTLVQTALFGKIHKIDIGQVNGTYFSIIAGIGFDADIMREAKRKLKSKFGLFAYFAAGFKHFNRSAGKYKVTVDGKESHLFRAKTILFANMGKLHGGIEAVPTAHAQSGNLSVGVLQTSTIPSWMNVLGNALIGNVNNSPHYTLLHGKHFDVECLRGPKPYECDGEHFPPTKHLSVDIFPQALAILVP